MDALGSQLIAGSRVIRCASDRNELVPDMESIPAALGLPETVVADNGYANRSQVQALGGGAVAGRRLEVLVSVRLENHRRRYDIRPPVAQKPKAKNHNHWVEAMRAMLASDEGRARYRLCQQSMEPVFSIDNVLGFRQFTLRVHERV